MENLTQVLLENYYGFGDDKSLEKSLASHEAFQKELLEEKSVVTDFNGNFNDEESSGVRQSLEVQIDHPDNNKVTVNDYLRNCQGSTEEDELIDESDLKDEEVNLIIKNAKKELHDDGKIEIPKLGVLERADGKDEMIDLGVVDEATPDSTSEISSLSTRKKILKKSKMSVIGRSDPPQSLILMPPMSKKNPVYNREFCDLTNSSIIEFPIKLLDEIPSIRMLYLENNCLNELPDQLFTSLRFLEWLDVRNNWLRTIPITIKDHQHLETILLQGNRIEKLPLEICLVPKLKTLQLAGNPLVFPSLSVISKGFNHIINYLRKEWNEENPNEPAIVTKGIKSTSTILCDNPPSLNTSRSSKFLTHSSPRKSLKNLSTRDKSLNYKPSNRCSGSRDNSLLDDKLRWISKVREMLIKQAAELQRIKDREVLGEWRNDRRSYGKSMKKAANRTKEEIPFDVNDDGMSLVKIKKSWKPMSISERKNMKTFGDMDRRMFEIVEAMGNHKFVDESQHLGTDLQLKLLEHEIKKIERLYDEIQALKRQNDTSSKKYAGPNIYNSSKSYEPPPSIIV